MPVLKDYINSLVSSITEARVSADLQTAKIAETYLKDDLLRNFSVPRMRIGDIEMNIPVAVEDASDKNTIVYRELCRCFSVSESSVPTTLSADLKKHITTGLNELATGAKSTYDVSNELMKVAIERFSEYGLYKEVDKEVVLKKLQVVLEAEGGEALGDINVIVAADKLKEQSSQGIIQVKLKVYEEGMEWSISENSKGEIETKLIPE